MSKLDAVINFPAPKLKLHQKKEPIKAKGELWDLWPCMAFGKIRDHTVTFKKKTHLPPFE